MLGFRAKQGYVIVRSRIRRGAFKRHCKKGQTMGKPKNQGVHELKLAKGDQALAERRAGKYNKALRILNSYWVGKDGSYKYYEVIMIDPQHPAIRKDPKINWIVKPVHKHRECRGLTSASKKSRHWDEELVIRRLSGDRDEATGRRETHCRCTDIDRHLPSLPEHSFCMLIFEVNFD